MKLPLPLPVLAAAGAAGGWLIGRAAQGSELAGAAATTPPPSAGSVDTSGDSASLDWGQDLGGAGVLPGSTGAGSVPPGDGYGNDGNWIPPVIPPFQPPVITPPPPPGVTPPPPTPPPPTGTLYSKPAGSVPSGAVGWTVVFGTSWRWLALSSWNGSYPVRLGAGGYFPGTSTRWVSAVRDGILTASGNAKRSVRRISHTGSNAAFSDAFMQADITVYPLSTGSVRR